MRGAQPFAFEDAPLLDARAFDDPLIAGVDHFGQFGIAQHVRRHIALNAGDRGAEFPHLCFRLIHAARFDGRLFGMGARAISRMPAARIERRCRG
jgi:hypothetical protein